MMTNRSHSHGDKLTAFPAVTMSSNHSQSENRKKRMKIPSAGRWGWVHVCLCRGVLVKQQEKVMFESKARLLFLSGSYRVLRQNDDKG